MNVEKQLIVSITELGGLHSVESNGQSVALHGFNGIAMALTIDEARELRDALNVVLDEAPATVSPETQAIIDAETWDYVKDNDGDYWKRTPDGWVMWSLTGQSWLKDHYTTPDMIARFGPLAQSEDPEVTE